MLEHADAHLAQPLEPLGEKAQRHALARARLAGDQRESAFRM